MPVEIHTTAVVDADSRLGVDVRVGPFAVIEAGAVVGDRTRIGAGAVVKSGVTLGADNVVKEHAVLGGDPQHLAYRGEETFLAIGDRNVIGEFVSMHRAFKPGEATRIGNDDYFMSYSHVGHDCVVGDRCVFTNYTALAGHCVVEDRAILAGYVGIHQFVRIGTMCMIGGDSKMNKDAAPYMLYLGVPARPIAVNLVGLKRNGVSEEGRSALRKAFKILFRSELNLPEALRRLRDEVEATPEIEHLIAFIESSPRGVAM